MRKPASSLQTGEKSLSDRVEACRTKKKPAAALSLRRERARSYFVGKGVLVRLNCELIFYLARRTGGCEEVLKKIVSRVGLRISTVSVSTKEGELCYALAQAVAHCNLVFVVGGLCSPIPQHINTVLSRALTIPLRKDTQGGPVLKGARILHNPDGANGYLLESGRQAIVLLPDVPAQIVKLVESGLLQYLCSKYSLTPRRQLAAQVAQGREGVPLSPVPEDNTPSVVLDLSSAGRLLRKKGKIPLAVKIGIGLAIVALTGAAAYACHSIWGLF